MPCEAWFRQKLRDRQKETQIPAGAQQSQSGDKLLVKASMQSFAWKRMLESGEFETLAECQGMTPSNVTGVLRLTLLVPDIVKAILDGEQGPEVTLTRVRSRPH